MTWPIRSLVLYVGLPIFSVCALTLYFWHKKEEEEWSELIKNLNLVERDVRVPQNVVGILVGRKGANIKEIQERTNTKINFRDGECHLEYATCRITGKSENVIEAVDLVMEAINSQANLKNFTMLVPENSCGKIIGRCGDTIQTIKRQSGAKITIDKKSNSGLAKKAINIQGTESEIQAAVRLIEEKVRENENLRSRLPLTFSKPPELKKPEYEKLIAIAGETSYQVYVSAFANPSHVWVQVIKPRAADLDLLIEEMTEYYGKMENRQPIDINKVKPGDVLACPMADNKWYRVEVRKLLPSESEDDHKVDVYYVDYGDSDFIPLSSLAYLHQDFLILRFQAVKVNIVGITPLQGDDWTDEAIACFEDLTHCGQWKVLMAEVVGYKRHPKDTSQAGEPLPCVKLFDPDGPPGIDIGSQLVIKGFAKTVPLEDEDMSIRYEVGYKNDFEENW